MRYELTDNEWTAIRPNAAQQTEQSHGLMVNCESCSVRGSQANAFRNASGGAFTFRSAVPATCEELLSACGPSRPCPCYASSMTGLEGVCA